MSSDGKMHNDDKYLASEFMGDFTNFEDLTRQTTRSMMKANRSKTPVNQVQIQSKIREQVIAQISEQGVAQLAGVDFSNEDYQFLIDEYIAACRNALTTIRETFPRLLSSFATQKINDLLATSFKTRLTEYQRTEPREFTFAM